MQIPVGNISYPNTGSPGTVSSEAEFTQPATLDRFSGKSLYVGVGKPYSNLKDAALAANSGDVIYVDE